MGYQVFIDRARDPSPLATVTLAKAIAERFRLPAEAISARLGQGRFRVKSGVDLATAERFAVDLEALGAVCTIVDEATQQPVVRSSAPASTAAAAPPAETPEPPPEAPHGPSEYQSGLAAAFGGGDAAAQDIGALSDPQSGSFSLATIDGADDAGRAAASAHAFAPPDAGAAPPADLFAPPEPDEELSLGFETAPPAPPIAPAAPPQQELLSLLPEGVAGGAAPMPAAAATGTPIQRGLSTLAQRAGMRAAVGAFLAMLLGFLVAHGVGALRESSAFDAPRANIAVADATYAATTVGTAAEQAELTAAFTKQRAAQQAIMNDSKRSIALLAGVIWLLVAAGTGFVWSRVIDWTRWA